MHIFFQPDVATIRLKLRKPKSRKKVNWTEETVDNENMDKKKSKCKSCMIVTGTKIILNFYKYKHPFVTFDNMDKSMNVLLKFQNCNNGMGIINLNYQNYKTLKF